VHSRYLVEDSIGEDVDLGAFLVDGFNGPESFDEGAALLVLARAHVELAMEPFKVGRHRRGIHVAVLGDDLERLLGRSQAVQDEVFVQSLDSVVLLGLWFTLFF